MLRAFDIDPAHCARCEGSLAPIAINTRDDIVQRILSHAIGPGGSPAWDLGDEHMDDWVLGMDPEPPDVDAPQRGPPCDECVDPPAPDC
jgi:hypothetical protein